MNGAQNRINNFISEIAFFKRLFKDAISKGFSTLVGWKWRPVQSRILSGNDKSKEY